MFRTIVIALDGSDFAQRAVPIGTALARRGGANVRAVAIARNDAELDWTYNRVFDDARLQGLDRAEVDLLVDPDPAKILLEKTAADGSVLCLATHDRPKPVTALMHSVGSEVIERATHPVVAVGSNASVESLAGDVVVALDGVDNPEPVLAVAGAWALQLHSRLRIVTVFEPVPPDWRRPEHYTRLHGPPGDPHVYLNAMAQRVSDVGLEGLETVAIGDPIGPAPGIEQHLAERPALLLVLGGGHPHRPHVHAGVAHRVLSNATMPVLIVNRTRPTAARTQSGNFD
jgi:nucleotide-binding universal stress UspA family protein